ncbi:glutamate 5-kinase [Clostridium thermosuccinogenes]|jgi:glutamate 5-kinase|uniref:Glutamate 5-kinase n=1 Tax=Clostridium thermosuccinogenes TaxID=84032 RepID=A0A2K2FHE1_9CLOT|nr:glutamate 5-kinase [Pseudoclostridium thermosuccinogenes]AUS97471.1 glutamate 5-kinase [Pseudoclostridium thermosuccinogenes]PNT93722.1 glutamate 5-kinase [Pseudoclostridium thermosuccinogenes]PNT98178.1 glutamate 5-kinase [Pseudoclostridium thermosuccinogenes]PNU00327.1 glutamate 5-kinase [Pseudoclostridium thermosuccinogenes]
MANIREQLKDAKRIVVKVGTSTLTYDTGKMNFTRIDRLARVLSDLVNQGREVILVSSGAIGVGVGMLKLKERPHNIREKQAVAAVGQCELMHIYSKFFLEYEHIVGQILLTRDILSNDYGRENVINTFEELLKKGVIPIVNENDSVSVEEIKAGQEDTFSENDTLSAIVAKLVKADLLIILSDIDGFYDCDPRKNECSKLISVIEEITPELEKCAEGAGTKRGTGGMITKLNAAKIATSSGVNMVLTNGDNPEIIMDIINGKDIGSLFLSKSAK